MTAPITPASQVSEEELKNAADASKKAIGELENLRNGADGSGTGLLKIQDYLYGRHPGPYIPKNADEEYKTLAQRSVVNWVLTVAKLAGESLYCEGHRLNKQSVMSPAWSGWQRNRMDGRQPSLYRDALSYGQAYAAVDKDPGRNPHRAGKARIRFFGALDTVSLWEDPVNDERPAFVLHTRKRADGDKPGELLMWDRDNAYEATYVEGGKDGMVISITKADPHGFSDTPVVAYTPYRDLTGRPSGIVVDLLGPNDKINQVNFDLNVVLSYGAHKVRYITGMVPPPKRRMVAVTFSEALAQGWIDQDKADELTAANTPETAVVARRWIDDIDEETGQAVPEPIQMSPRDLVIIEEAGAKAGTFDGTDPTGYISAKSDARSDLASVAQIPNHWVTGNIANLAADALAVAEGPWWRMIDEFQKTFGESHEMLLQLVAECDGLEGADDYETEVVWTDKRDRSVAQVVDALVKGRQGMDIPREALWAMWPGVTGGQLARWRELRDEEIQNHEAGAEASFEQAFSSDAKKWATTRPVVTEDDDGLVA